MTVARRLITVALTDFLCWFPIGLCGLLALADVPIPGEVSVAMAIFVLPLNSALNPFLYTNNVVMETRRKKTDEKMLRELDASLKQDGARQMTSRLSVTDRQTDRHTNIQTDRDRQTHHMYENTH
jgi:hypothetical protein